MKILPQGRGSQPPRFVDEYGGFGFVGWLGLPPARFPPRRPEGTTFSVRAAELALLVVLGAPPPVPKMRFAAHAEGENEQSQRFALVAPVLPVFLRLGGWLGVRL